MEWVIRKKGISEVIVGAGMSLHDGAKTRVRVGSAYSKEFEVKVGIHQGSVLLPRPCSHEQDYGRLEKKILDLELQGCTGK